MIRFLLPFLLVVMTGFSANYASYSPKTDPLVSNHDETYIAAKRDPVLRESVEVLPILEEHFNAYESYTVNQMTPGYKEFTFGNVMEDGKVYGRKFFRLGQGPPVETGGALDVYIEGKVMYVVQAPWGLAFTRDGRFDIDIHGRLVTFADQFLVLGENGPVLLGDKQDVYISSKGEIYKGGDLIDVIRVIQFANLNQIDSYNSHMYFSIVDFDVLEKEENPTYFLRQGYYEGAAVVKGLIGEVPRFTHVYQSSIYVVQRALRMYQSAITMGSHN